MKTYLLIAVLAASCAGTKNDPEVPVAVGSCSHWCARRAVLGCDAMGSPGHDEKFGTDDDVPCEQVCSDVIKSAVFEVDVACFDTALSCESLEVCILGGASE